MFIFSKINDLGTWTLLIMAYSLFILWDPVALFNPLTDLLLGIGRPRVPILWTVLWLNDLAISIGTSSFISGTRFGPNVGLGLPVAMSWVELWSKTEASFIHPSHCLEGPAPFNIISYKTVLTKHFFTRNLPCALKFCFKSTHRILSFPIKKRLNVETRGRVTHICIRQLDHCWLR